MLVRRPLVALFCFYLTAAAAPAIYTLSLHDALPIFPEFAANTPIPRTRKAKYVDYRGGMASRSEEHTSELQSLTNIVCRLLLEKKKKDEKASAPDRA